jgi:hypothetical protein
LNCGLISISRTQAFIPAATNASNIPIGRPGHRNRAQYWSYTACAIKIPALRNAMTAITNSMEIPLRSMPRRDEQLKAKRFRIASSFEKIGFVHIAGAGIDSPHLVELQPDSQAQGLCPASGFPDPVLLDGPPFDGLRPAHSQIDRRIKGGDGILKTPSRKAVEPGRLVLWLCLARFARITFHSATKRFNGALSLASVPIPKFVSLCGDLVYELRNRKDTSKPMILVWLWFGSPHDEPTG